MAFLPVAEQLKIIRRGVSEIVPEAELKQKLEHSHKTGKPLNVKLGLIRQHRTCTLDLPLLSAS